MTLGVNSYVSPGMCATKKATGDMYGSRQKLWDMTYLYKEIEDFAKFLTLKIAVRPLLPISKNARPTCVRNSARIKKTFRLSSGSPSSSPSADAYVGGKNSPSGFIASLMGGHNAITSETEMANRGVGKALLPPTRT